MFGRRRFLSTSSALAAATAFGYRAVGAPAIRSHTIRPVTQTFQAIPHVDGAGVHLTRAIGHPGLPNLDPFVLLDRMHSNNPPDYVLGFPMHPHRGFETVTVMLDGQVRHHDSRGNQGLITGGGAQWMTAGRGIVHSEMPEQEAGWLSGFQLWINLPSKEKMCPQEYQDLKPARLASGKLSAGGELRVIAGEAQGLVGPVHHRVTEPLLLTVALEDERPLEIDVAPGHAAWVFAHEGVVEVGPESGSTSIADGTLAVLGPGNRLRLRATNQRSGVLVAAARPLHEPIVQRGPFVMNTEAEINQAIEDYRNNVLDKA